MTTAARPTFEPARGGQGRGEKDLSALSKQYSSRDLPGHTKLKYREHGQGTAEELQSRDFRRELEEREQREREKESKNARGRIQDASHSKRQKFDQIQSANLDADDPVDDDDDDSDSDGSDSEDDSMLLAELAKIRKERAAEEARKEIEKKQEEERIRMENIFSGNPLLNYTANQAPKADLKVKRRWDEDVVFKNCARSEPDKKKEFINDSLRSEFHKRFMEKYIK